MVIVDCWHRVSTTSTTWLYHDTGLKLLIGNVNNTLHGIRLQGGGHSHMPCSHNCDRGQDLDHQFFTVWLLTAQNFRVLTVVMCVLWWVCCKLKWYFDCWPAAKNPFWPLTALWPRSQLWLQSIWEWPSPWAGQMGNCFVSDSVQNLARTTQRTNTRQVSACSQEPVDSTDANIVGTSTSLKTIR